MPSRNRALLFWLFGISVLNVACSSISNPSPARVAVTPSQSSALPDDLEKATISQSNSPSAKVIYEQAIDAAYSAELLGESAVSLEDWQLSLSRWQEAIALLRQIPSNNALYAMSKPKIAEYQSRLSLAKQQPPRPRREAQTGVIIANAPSPPQIQKAPAPKATSANPQNQQVYTVPIKRRSGRTPIIDVTFNGGQVFEMIIDTGASGTVITPEMAQNLGLAVEGEVTADTASDKGVKFSTTTIESIAVAGAVANNVRVAIGTDDLEVGLLGQDFFSKYDVLIRQNIVEFHQR